MDKMLFMIWPDDVGVIYKILSPVKNVAEQYCREARIMRVCVTSLDRYGGFPIHCRRSAIFRFPPLASDRLDSRNGGDGSTVSLGLGAPPSMKVCAKALVCDGALCRAEPLHLRRAGRRPKTPHRRSNRRDGA
jgi:hypothetical protein